jgi:hypothetical protein
MKMEKKNTYCLIDNLPIGSEWGKSSKDGRYIYTIIRKFKDNMVEVQGSDGVVRRINIFKLQTDYFKLDRK